MGGAHLRKARRALENLVALSRENRPMTAAELLAEAKVMKLAMKSASRRQSCATQQRKPAVASIGPKNRTLTNRTG